MCVRVCGQRTQTGGESWQRVKLPDSLVDKAVPQSAGPSPQAPQSSA